MGAALFRRGRQFVDVSQLECENAPRLVGLAEADGLTRGDVRNQARPPRNPRLGKGSFLEATTEPHHADSATNLRGLKDVQAP
eukprot:11231462-Alexandrium_andersonii.AAC.1